MNKVRQLLLAAVLTLTFALSVSAGEIECGIVQPPPPPPAAPAVFNVTWTILQAVLSVF